MVIRVMTAPKAGPPRWGRPTRRSISAPTIAGCWSRARPATASASSMRSRASSGSAKGVSASGRLSEAAIERAVEALAICRDKMAQPRRHARAADRDRGLPRGRERRRVPRPRRRGGRPRARDHRPRDRGRARRHRLHAADRSGRRRRHPVRYRRRLLRAGAARALGAGAARPAAAEDRGLDLAAGRRGDAGRAPRRPRGHAATSTRP